MAVGAWDGMAPIYDVIKQLNGELDGDKAMGIVKAYKTESPRGPIWIDPATRDVVQTVYVRRAEKMKDGRIYNVEIAKFSDVKDPGK